MLQLGTIPVCQMYGKDAFLSFRRLCTCYNTLSVTFECFRCVSQSDLSCANILYLKQFELVKTRLRAQFVS